MVFCFYGIHKWFNVCSEAAALMEGALFIEYTQSTLRVHLWVPESEQH